MNILNKLVFKEIKNNKKRFFSSIMAISLACALFFVIGFVFSTLHQNQVTSTLAETGDYHTHIVNFSYNDIGKVTKIEGVKKLTIFASFFTGRPDKASYYNICVYEIDDNTLSNIEIINGMVPLNQDEIIISDITAQYFQLKVNDYLTLTSNDSEKQFLITGIYKDVKGLLGSEYMTYQTLTVSSFNENSYVNAVITYNKMDKKIYKIGEELKYNLTFSKDIIGMRDSNIFYNTNLLHLYGIGSGRDLAFIGVMIFLLMIVLTIISFVTFFIIYNSFLISISERKKTIGTLASIGSTPKQIIKSIFFESFLIYIISLILGFLLSVLFSHLYFGYINYQLEDIITYKYYIYLNPIYIVIALSFTFLTVIMATFSSSLRASEISPIDLIRQKDDIKYKKGKTNQLFLKLFGIEGEYARKNMKRNKSKFKISLISMVISIVLLVSFGTILNFFAEIVEKASPLNNMSIRIVFKDEDEIKDEIRNIKYIDKIVEYYHQTIGISGLDQFSSDLYKEYLEAEKFYNKQLGRKVLNHVITDAFIIKDEDFAQMTKDYKLPESDIYISKDFYYGSSTLFTGTDNYEEAFNTKNISSIDLCKDSYHFTDKLTIIEGKCDKKINNIPVIKNTLLDISYSYKPVMFIKESYYNTMLDYHMIITYDDEANKEFIERIMGKNKHLNIISKKYLKFDKEINNIFSKNNIIANEGKIEYYNELVDNAAMIKVVQTIGWGIYAFLIYIAMIGVLSIYNTIYASNELRSREFLVLRSIGMEEKGFRKIAAFESLILSTKALFLSIPIVYTLINIIFKVMNFEKETTNESKYGFELINPPYKYIIFSFIIVFIVVLVTNLLATKKIKKQDIITSIK